MPEEYSKDEFVTVFTSRKHDAEQEAESVHALLESAGLNSLIVRENVPELPIGRVSVKVLASDTEDAKNLIHEAQQGAGQAAEDSSGS